MMHPMNVIAQQLHALALKVEAIEKAQAQQVPQPQQPQQPPPIDLTDKIRGLEEKIDRVLASRKLTETVVTLKMESEIKRLEEKMKQMVLNHAPIANSLCILPDVAAAATLPVAPAAVTANANANAAPDAAPAPAAPAAVDDFEIKLKVKKPPKSSK